MRRRAWPRAAVIAMTICAGPGWAEDEAAQASALDEEAPALTLELNTLTQLDSACRLTFYAGNYLGADIDHLSLEAVIFTTQAQVERLTLFDLGALPEGRPRVRQFDLPGLPCDTIGQVLVNAMSACEGEGLDPAICLEATVFSSLIDAELNG